MKQILKFQFEELDTSILNIDNYSDSYVTLFWKRWLKVKRETRV